MQSSVSLTTINGEDIAPGGTLLFTLPVGHTTAEMLSGQTVYLTVYSRDFTDLATDMTGATDVGVVWPADAPYPLPPGEYNCEFRTSAPEELPADAGQANTVADVTKVADAVDAATVDLPGLATAYNTCVAAHDELATQFNALLHNLQAAGLMAKP